MVMIVSTISAGISEALDIAQEIMEDTLWRFTLRILG